MSMLVTCGLSDVFGRRPLTVYPYAVTVAAVLALGIVGCFDYSTKALSSLLVSPVQRAVPVTDAVVIP
jgi:SP family general alpha glucoside:H+ symporter-like MFS transporter